MRGNMYNVLSAAVTVLSLAVVVLMETEHFSGHLAWVVLGVDFACCAFFWWEFGAGWRKATDRRRYAAAHSLDLLGAIPAVFALRWFRLIRLLKLLRLLRVGLGAGRLWQAWTKALRMQPGLSLGTYCVLVVTLGAQALYIAEHGANASIASYWDCVWLVLTTLTTIGYGDIYPITPLGRGLSICIAVLGMGLLASFTAVIAAGIMSAHAEQRPDWRG